MLPPTVFLLYLPYMSSQPQPMMYHPVQIYLNLLVYFAMHSIDN